MAIKITNDLLKKYAANQCSERERIYVERWYNEYSSKKELNATELGELATTKQEIWDGVFQQVDQKRKPNFFLLKTAAAILIIACISVLIFQLNRGTIQSSSNKRQENFVSGKVGAKIYTSLVSQTVDDSSKFLAIIADFKIEEPITISTANGEEYHTSLPDGSEIWLNSNSELVIRGDFNKIYRDIDLRKGEGYFKVAKDKTKPFRVFVEGTKIEALGTEFNVSRYGGAKNFKAFLVEGSIRVSKNDQQAVIKPNQLFEINDRSGKSSVIEIKNPTTQYAWKTGYFEYANTPLPEIVAELSRWYNFKYTIHQDYKNKTLTGKITKTQPFTEVLAILEFSGISYRKEGSTLILAP